MLLQNIRCLLQIGRLRCRYQTVFGHHLVDSSFFVSFKTQIAIGYNTHQSSIVIDNGNTSDMVLFHESQSISYGRRPIDRYRVINHTVLGTFYAVYLFGLSFYRHIFMNNTDAPFTSDRYGQTRFGNGIHRCRNKWYIQLYITGKTG